jgi:hypothetical protein
VRPSLPSASSEASSSSPKPISDRSGAHAPQVGQLDPQQRLVPAGVQRQLVVREDVGALLRLGPAAGDHHRHLGDAELARRHHAAMAGDQPAALVHQDRCGPAPLADAGGDLRHLRVGVRACVPRVRHQPGHAPSLDPIRRPRMLDGKHASLFRQFRNGENPTRGRSAAGDA